MRLEGKQTSKQSVRSLFNHFYSILWAGTDGSVEGSWSQSSLDELCKGPIGLEGSTICSECMCGRLPHSRWHFVPVWSAGVWDESCAETQQQHLFSFWAHQKLEIIPTSKHSQRNRSEHRTLLDLVSKIVLDLFSQLIWSSLTKWWREKWQVVPATIVWIHLNSDRFRRCLSYSDSCSVTHWNDLISGYTQDHFFTSTIFCTANDLLLSRFNQAWSRRVGASGGNPSLHHLFSLWSSHIWDWLCAVYHDDVKLGSINSVHFLKQSG